MISINDYIRVKRKSAVILKYHLFCDKCGKSKGYQTKDKNIYQCRSCASKREKSDLERENISNGVKKYYNNKHNNIEIINYKTESHKLAILPQNIPIETKESKWKRIRRECKSRDIKRIDEKYDYSDSELQEILKLNCFYCGSISTGLDRIDNTKGHSKENTIPCCHLCNMTRGDRYTVEEFKLIGKVIAKIRALR